MKSNTSHMLTSKGFTSALLDLFPAIDWTPENKAVFSTVLDRTVKLFKKVQMENQVKPVVKIDFMLSNRENVYI